MYQPSGIESASGFKPLCEAAPIAFTSRPNPFDTEMGAD